jgi:3-hydroxyisobutyrate dehydrogenase-like beta-hydroxyacid dehydrogenase
MGSTAIALFHPGDMGSAVGACAVANGHRVLCALEGRSAASRARAEKARLENAGSVKAALSASSVVLSIAPPHGALTLAKEIAGLGFKGVYIDCNAISPETARRIGSIVEAAGASFVDGGLMGGPPTAERPVTLRLSGPRALEAAKLFEGSQVRAAVLDGPVGAASALKNCYAAWTKGTWLLLSSILATADHEGVAEPLKQLWSESQPAVFKQISAPSNNPAKGWRWVSEMHEIAATFESAGQPDGFFLAAAEICRRLEQYKDVPGLPSIEQIVNSIQKDSQKDPKHEPA